MILFIVLFIFLFLIIMLKAPYCEHKNRVFLYTSPNNERPYKKFYTYKCVKCGKHFTYEDY